MDYWDATDPESVKAEPWSPVDAEQQELTFYDSDVTSGTYLGRPVVLENGQRNEALSNGDPVIIEVTLPPSGRKD